jgi:F0F1-type ATP synthase membrane subunit b/b'
MNTNIVFWLIVIAAIVLLWFCLSFAFKGIGGFALKLYNDAKNEITETKENSNNEG